MPSLSFSSLYGKIQDFLNAYRNPTFWTIAFLAMFSALPLHLTGSTLAAWLKDEGFSYETIGLLSALGLPRCFKFLIAPFVDRLSLGYFSRQWGQHRAWLVLSQIFITFELMVFAQLNPHEHMMALTCLAFCLSVTSCFQDVAMLGYQMARLNRPDYGPGEAMSIFGYRMGMILSGAGSLYIAHYLSWNKVYCIMAGLMALSIIFTLSTAPTANTSKIARPKIWIDHSLKEPLKDFFSRSDWLWALLLMASYKMGDNLIGHMRTIFYLDLGFSKIDIAQGDKIFGMAMTLLGGFIGGWMVARQDILKSLFFCAVAHGISTLAYVVMYYSGTDFLTFYISVAIEHLTGGMRATALLSYQLILCNKVFAGTQLSLLISFVNLGRTVTGTLSGWLVSTLGWPMFFTVCAVSTIPSLIFILKLHYHQHNKFHSYGS
jgi:PAT family beta-lactamase induction signal transducer AmpG